LREAMSLDFYTWLFLKRQKEVDEGGDKGGKGWLVNLLWKKLLGGERKGTEEKGLLKTAVWGI
jgi:hypothetical protein